jgi:hypothetical protein
MEDYKKKGYFMMADGVKSTEYTNPMAKKKVKATDAIPKIPKKVRSTESFAGGK